MQTRSYFIQQQRQARQFAGRTVAEMIRLGCCPGSIRQAGVPRLTFHWALGARTWESSNPTSAALHLITQLPADSLGLAVTCDRAPQMRPGAWAVSRPVCTIG